MHFKIMVSKADSKLSDFEIQTENILQQQHSRKLHLTSQNFHSDIHKIMYKYKISKS